MFQNAKYNPLYKGYAIMLSLSDYALLHESIQDTNNNIDEVWENIYEIPYFDRFGVIEVSKDFNQKASKHNYALLSYNSDNLEETLNYIKSKWGILLPKDFDYDNRICYFIAETYYNGEGLNEY